MKRRTLSINGKVYARLKARCAELGISVSAQVEKLIEVDLASVQVPERAPDRAPCAPTPEQIEAREVRRGITLPTSTPYVEGFCANDCEHAGPFVRSDDGYVLCVVCATRPAEERRPTPRVYTPPPRKEHGTSPVHGTIYTYKQLRCRCVDCRNANSAYENGRRGRAA